MEEYELKKFNEAEEIRMADFYQPFEEVCVCVIMFTCMQSDVHIKGGKRARERERVQCLNRYIDSRMRMDTYVHSEGVSVSVFAKAYLETDYT